MIHDDSSPAAAPEKADGYPAPTSSALRPLPQALVPVRGLIPMQNRIGQPVSQLDIRRWIRLNVIVYKTQKIDLAVSGCPTAMLEDLFLYIHDPNRTSGVQLSLRTDCAAPPDRLEALCARNLYDVFLCPADPGREHLASWLEACANLEIPIRVQLVPPFADDLDAVVELLSAHRVRVADITVTPPFIDMKGRIAKNESAEQVARMNRLAAQLAEKGIEANLIGLPFCHVTEANRVRAYNSPQLALDHQHYEGQSFELALTAYDHRMWAITKLVQLNLATYTSRKTIIDRYILAWLIIEHPMWHSLLTVFRRLTRHLRFFGNPPRVVEETKEAYEAEVNRRAEEAAAALGPECGQCGLRRICDHNRGPVQRALPGLSVKAQPGDLVVSPWHFVREQPKYLDSIDFARAEAPEHQTAMVEAANHLIRNVAPTREFGFRDLNIENSFHIQMPGAIQWFSITNGEVRSLPMSWLETPYTVSVTFGGGIADQIGFAIGRYIRVMCPMEGYAHQLVLHVDSQGKYVLLRDGIPMRPTEYAGAHSLPEILPTTAPVCLATYNIDRFIFTQNLMLWERPRDVRPPATNVKYSIIIVSTRFARRLQAVLRCIAHQEGVDLSMLEVIVAYVPGLDSTDDLITSVELAYPNLRVIRSPFLANHANAKGFMINESAELACGERIVLLDSDILIPPNMMETLENTREDAVYIAPDRRKMLSPAVTAKVLMGELEPWRQWDELLNTPGAVRIKEGGHLPIGFFQCTRAEHFRKVKYREFEHFQGADWDFVVDLYEQIGPGVWLNDLAVCHLDHGGSQWFGAQRQM